MEQRLIDANALIKSVNGVSTHWLNDWSTLGVLSMIDKQPTVDAVPVIRCSKCRMSFVADESAEMYGAEIGKRYCSNGRKVTDDFFCADGKRKDGKRG